MLSDDNPESVWHNSGRRARNTTRRVDYKKLSGDADDDVDFFRDDSSDDDNDEDFAGKRRRRKKGTKNGKKVQQRRQVNMQALAGEGAGGGGEDFVLNPHIAQLVHRTFDDPSKVVKVVKDGTTLTAESIRSSKGGLSSPLLVTDHHTSLGMKMPGGSGGGNGDGDGDLTVRDVADCIGWNYPVNVMDCANQTELPGWTMADLVSYFENPTRMAKTRNIERRVERMGRGGDGDSGAESSTSDEEEDDDEGESNLPRILNQISLEFSDTPLRDLALSPSFVREMDWIDTAWPASQKTTPDSYPRVQYYCLTSTLGAYTDFHLDFGGTSVWYHVLHGAKTFLLVPPTPHNLEEYEKWLCSADQATVFYPDRGVDACYRVSLEAGQTMVIPTGWIHAVYTPRDSVVFGGNFLHSLDIGGQLAVHCIETRTRVPQKFRFPKFVQMMFYAGSLLLRQMRAGRICDGELDGLPGLIDALGAWNHAGGDARGKGTVAEAAHEAAALAGCDTVDGMLEEMRRRVAELEEARRDRKKKKKKRKRDAKDGPRSGSQSSGRKKGGLKLKLKLKPPSGGACAPSPPPSAPPPTTIVDDDEEGDAAVTAAPKKKIRLKLVPPPPPPGPPSTDSLCTGAAADFGSSALEGNLGTTESDVTSRFHPPQPLSPSPPQHQEVSTGNMTKSTSPLKAVVPPAAASTKGGASARSRLKKKLGKW